MADQYYHHTSPDQGRGVLHNSAKPRLPNFDHFVRGAGHPNLANSPSTRWDYGSESITQMGHPSLPTPPPTTTNVPFWDGDSQQRAWNTDHTGGENTRPVPGSETHRRASFALPIQARPQPRAVRAYSSNNTDRVYRDFEDGHTAAVIQEEEHAGYQASYGYTAGDAVPGEVSSDVGGSIWGITKAGKPRKRLSQACNTCREKKIKCDPAYGTKCSQCLRFNRECRFGTNPRQGHKGSKFRTSVDSSAANTGLGLIHSPREHHLPSRRSSITPSDVSNPTDVAHPTISRSSTSADEFISPTMSDRQPNDAPTPSKRQRTSTDSHERASDSHHNHHDLSRRSSSVNCHQTGYAADIDPIVANEKLTRHYLDLFMDFINIPTFEIFPRRRMLEWAINELGKSLQDRLGVYAMMALATVHSNDPNRSTHRAVFKSIIYEHLDRIENDYSLQVAHILLFLGFVEFADAQHQKGFSVFVRTVGCIAYLQLNVEHHSDSSPIVYGLSPSMTAECRRRTFWAAFATDTYAALSKGDPRIMHNTDIFLRMPCASELYETDKIPEIPMFDQENALTGIPNASELIQMADMVHLIQIAMICGEVQLNSWRCRNALKIGRLHLQDSSTRKRLEARLKIWAETYSTALRAKEHRSSIADPYVGTRESGARAKRYAGLDILYHYAHMELNRRVYHKPLGQEEMLAHAKNANLHALETLKLTQQLLKQGGSETKDYFFATRGPLGGYAVHTALDIITAAGSISDILAPQSSIMTLMWGGCELLEHLSAWWASAKLQHMQAKERIQKVFNLCQAALYDHKTHFYCSDPMSPGLETEFDMIYGMDRAQYLKGAYGLIKVKPSDIVEIDTGGKDQRLVVS